jgi:peptidyl-prolyl cis-trans isomerase C
MERIAPVSGGAGLAGAANSARRGRRRKLYRFTVVEPGFSEAATAMRMRILGILVTGLAMAGVALAQNPPQGRPTSSAGAAAVNVTAATVNGTPISEITVQRALKRVPPDKHAEARKEILDMLVDNSLIEQYLVQQKVVVDQKEIQGRMAEFQAEMQKQKKDMATMMREMNLSDEEMRYQIAADLRWEKFANSKATEPVLQDMFQKNQIMFDGSKVRARHILLTPSGNQTIETAKAQLLAVKKEVLAAGDAAVAKMPATADATAKNQAHAQAVEQAFSKAAEKYSACPSKQVGGDLDYFPRAGSMVEPFAKAAFALKPYEVSEPVATQFGMHLIMATGRKAGTPVTYDKVKEEVKEIYCGQMREQLCAQLRATAKINIGGAAATKQ